MYRNRTFACVNIGSQSETIRLNWLPSYIKDDVVTQMCRLRGGGDSLSCRNRTFGVVNLGSQEVTVRLHWLPVYIKDSIVKQV